MTVQFILMTLAFVILLIVTILQQKRIKELNNKFHDLYNKKWTEYMGFGKSYRRRYKYIIIENHDEQSLNSTTKRNQDEGYDLDFEKSTDRLLVFVKNEEVMIAPKKH